MYQQGAWRRGAFRRRCPCAAASWRTRWAWARRWRCWRACSPTLSLARAPRPPWCAANPLPTQSGLNMHCIRFAIYRHSAFITWPEVLCICCLTCIKQHKLMCLCCWPPQLSYGLQGSHMHGSCGLLTALLLLSQEASTGVPTAANDDKAEDETKAEDGASGGSQQGAQSRPEGPAAGTRRRPRARIAAVEDSDAGAGAQGSPGETSSNAANSSSSDTGAVSTM